MKHIDINKLKVSSLLLIMVVNYLLHRIYTFTSMCLCLICIAKLHNSASNLALISIYLYLRLLVLKSRFSVWLICFLKKTQNLLCYLYTLNTKMALRSYVQLSYYMVSYWLSLFTIFIIGLRKGFQYLIRRNPAICLQR